MPRLRQNLLTGEWIIFSPERAKRPEEFILPRQHMVAPQETCLFCPGGPAYQTRIAETEDMYVIPNKFPAFAPELSVSDDGQSLYANGQALGLHEVIIRKDHNVHLLDLSAARLAQLMGVLAARMRHAATDPQLEAGVPFHNHGQEAGSSIGHPHSQLIASALIPPRIEMMIRQQKLFYAERGECLLCQMWRTEAADRRRVLAESSSYIAFLPYASRYPYEVMIVPKHHAALFERLDESHLSSFSAILHTVLKRYKTVLHDPALNWAIFSRPFRPRIGNEAWHWHFSLMPRLEHFGGYELATGAIITTLSPERACAYLRQHE